MLDTIRLSRGLVFPPGGEALYRQIGRLTGMEEGTEVLDVACGRAAPLFFLAESFGVTGAGVDAAPSLVAEAEERARAEGLGERLHFQSAPVDDLPYRDETYDVVIGELGLAAAADPARIVRELARVTKPMGTVALIQLVWTGNADPEQRALLVDRLGAEPMLLVEWKQLLREAGIVDLVVEDWSDAPSPFRPLVDGRCPDFSESFSFRDKLRVLRRAVQRWGLAGVRGALEQEREIHALLTRERVLGLSLIKGVRWQTGSDPAAP